MIVGALRSVSAACPAPLKHFSCRVGTRSPTAAFSLEAIDGPARHDALAALAPPVALGAAAGSVVACFAQPVSTSSWMVNSAPAAATRPRSVIPESFKQNRSFANGHFGQLGHPRTLEQFHGDLGIGRSGAISGAVTGNRAGPAR